MGEDYAYSYITPLSVVFERAMQTRPTDHVLANDWLSRSIDRSNRFDDIYRPSTSDSEAFRNWIIECAQTRKDSNNQHTFKRIYSLISKTKDAMHYLMDSASHHLQSLKFIWKRKNHVETEKVIEPAASGIDRIASDRQESAIVPDYETHNIVSSNAINEVTEIASKAVSDSIENIVSTYVDPEAKARIAVNENRARVNVYNTHGLKELRKYYPEFTKRNDAYTWLNGAISIGFDVRYNKRLLGKSAHKDETIESIVNIYRNSRNISDAITEIRNKHHLKISKSSIYRILDDYAVDKAAETDGPVQWIRKQPRCNVYAKAPLPRNVFPLYSDPAKEYVFPTRPGATKEYRDKVVAV